MTNVSLLIDIPATSLSHSVNMERSQWANVLDMPVPSTGFEWTGKFNIFLPQWGLALDNNNNDNNNNNNSNKNTTFSNYKLHKAQVESWAMKKPNQMLKFLLQPIQESVRACTCPGRLKEGVWIRSGVMWRWTSSDLIYEHQVKNMSTHYEHIVNIWVIGIDIVLFQTFSVPYFV